MKWNWLQPEKKRHAKFKLFEFNAADETGETLDGMRLMEAVSGQIRPAEQAKEWRVFRSCQAVDWQRTFVTLTEGPAAFCLFFFFPLFNDVSIEGLVGLAYQWSGWPTRLRTTNSQGRNMNDFFPLDEAYFASLWYFTSWWPSRKWATIIKNWTEPSLK